MGFRHVYMTRRVFLRTRGFERIFCRNPPFLTSSSRDLTLKSETWVPEREKNREGY